MAAVETAMLAGLPYQRLRDAVIAHLTMAEGLGLAPVERACLSERDGKMSEMRESVVRRSMRVTVNGQMRAIKVEPRTTLLDALREGWG